MFLGCYKAVQMVDGAPQHLDPDDGLERATSFPQGTGWYLPTPTAGNSSASAPITTSSTVSGDSTRPPFGHKTAGRGFFTVINRLHSGHSKHPVPHLSTDDDDDDLDVNDWGDYGNLAGDTPQVKQLAGHLWKREETVGEDGATSGIVSTITLITSTSAVSPDELVVETPSPVLTPDATGLTTSITIASEGLSQTSITTVARPEQTRAGVKRPAKNLVIRSPISELDTASDNEMASSLQARQPDDSDPPKEPMGGIATAKRPAERLLPWNWRWPWKRGARPPPAKSSGSPSNMLRTSTAALPTDISPINGGGLGAWMHRPAAALGFNQPGDTSSSTTVTIGTNSTTSTATPAPTSSSTSRVISIVHIVPLLNPGNFHKIAGGLVRPRAVEASPTAATTSEEEATFVAQVTHQTATGLFPRHERKRKSTKTSRASPTSTSAHRKKNRTKTRTRTRTRSRKTSSSASTPTRDAGPHLSSPAPYIHKPAPGLQRPPPGLKLRYITDAARSNGTVSSVPPSTLETRVSVLTSTDENAWTKKVSPSGKPNVKRPASGLS
ncbi:hypothetical protein BU23DRAFT_564773 [Bimuria novae-zelandiae CBS 107.79]|uniref:Uncharacterized protein n=1 Tax=Bimuria novae-zelandiae CBS 107.79 TaxID=1447943 RepID=A0A6A5VSR7_9PLEO|nr:hypothetical protein BU23DRAFT_564773 [Bimuria novae-zelandiae CBS 107.79]